MRIQDSTSKQCCINEVKLVIEGYNTRQPEKNEQNIWCNQNIKNDNFWYSLNEINPTFNSKKKYKVEYYFEFEEDAISFKLAWG